MNWVCRCEHRRKEDCEATELREQLAALTKERDSLTATVWHYRSIRDERLASEQAYSEKLREALKLYVIREGEGVVFANSPAQKALALPHSTEALDARLKEERERVARQFDKPENAGSFYGPSIAAAIRSMA